MVTAILELWHGFGVQRGTILTAIIVEHLTAICIIMKEVWDEIIAAGMEHLVMGGMPIPFAVSAINRCRCTL